MKKYLPFLLMAVVFFAVYQYCFDSKLDLNGDNASYIQLARTLSDGHGYSNVSPSGFTPARLSGVLGFFRIAGPR